LAALYTVPALSSQQRSGVPIGGDAVTFVVPPGYGPAAELIVVVDGVPSANATFTYDAPAISNLAPDRTNLTTPGTLNVWIDGSSLCASTVCGYVEFNRNRVPAISTPVWTDSLIKIVVADPTDDSLNTIQVFVGGVGSNVLTFSKPVPNFAASAQPRIYSGMSALGGEDFKVVGVLSVGQVQYMIGCE
jgi:hypothetical protein